MGKSSKTAKSNTSDDDQVQATTNRKYANYRWLKLILGVLGSIIVAVIGCFGLGIASAIPPLIERIFPTSAVESLVYVAATGDAIAISTPTLKATSGEIFTPAQSPRICKPIIPNQPFSVIDYYDPSGQIGDIGDIISVNKTEGVIQFKYEPKGSPPHKWEYTYENGALSNNPAKFAGIVLLDPPNNFGTNPQGGYDLRPVSGKIQWEARSLQGNATVDFFIGGINWIWDEKILVKVEAPYPDSMPYVHLSSPFLNSQWQTHKVDLSHLPDDYFRCVIGALGWSIAWGADRPSQYIIEIRNITYIP
jgi:hypothetical protein